MKALWIGSNLLITLVVAGTGSALAQVASEPASYSTRLSAPRRPAGAAQRSEPPLELRLTARYAPVKELVRSLVRVAPHADNRFLRITVDSWSYYSSSDIQLDGASAAKNHFFAWRSLPPGVYDVTVTIFGLDGPRSERKGTFEVVGVSPMEEPMPMEIIRNEPQ